MLLSAVIAVCCAFLAMTGVAALGLHLLGADAYGSLGPMTAAVMVLAVGGSVTPRGAVPAFGESGVTAETAIDIVPLGVGLTGALVLGTVFLRSVRAVPGGVTPGGLAARAATVAALFTALVGGLTWAGHDSVTIPGRALIPGPGDGGDGGDGPLDRLPDLPGLGELPDLGDLPDLGRELPGMRLPDGLADLADARLRVDFEVVAWPSLVAGAVWVLAVLLIALAASRRTPLPRALAGAGRAVRPAASALTQVLCFAVLLGLAAGVYGVTSGGQSRRALGAALLGAPNGAWLALPLGLSVPWHGSASGAPLPVLPAPLRELLGGGGERPLTLQRLAEQSGWAWLAVLVAVALMLLAGVLTAARTARGGSGVPAYAGGCALRLGALTAVAVPLLVWLTEVTADVRLSFMGIGVHGAGLDLRGNPGAGLLLGALWGAAAGLAGALLAAWAGLAGRSAADPPVPVHGPPVHGPAAYGPGYGSGYGDPERPGPYRPSRPYRRPNPDTNPYMRPLPPHGEPPRAEPPRETPPRKPPPHGSDTA
ncbi:hypothetical protein CCS38_08505, partial [Streptomyces purpurogeneiscleroticus]|nr:hypothetical protein [Streptomyces purpurogeneiscleroticus]